MPCAHHVHTLHTVHTVHTACTPAEGLPSTQALHTVAPRDDENDPTLQPTQALAPRPEYAPVSQDAHSFILIAQELATYSPAAQIEQALVPLLVESFLP